MNKSNSTLPKRLRLAREQAGLSQGQIANFLGVHRPTISEIEAGRRKVSSVELANFAQHYGVSTSWLLDEQSSENPSVELAARELSRLAPQDLDRILNLLKSMRSDTSEES